MSSAPHQLTPVGKASTGARQSTTNSAVCVTVPHQAWYALASRRGRPAWASAQLQRAGSHALPHGNWRRSGPRAAYSHWASVGSDAPAHSQ